ncbi:MAG: hypothetical protein ABSH42_02535 [Bryobacteraceae bacterium]|jgi:hypothetical protein
MSKLAIFLTVVACLLFAAMAAPLSIGFIRSNGEFRVDGSTIRQNGTLFDGNLIETTAARSVIELASVEITLSPDSRAKVYRDHTILEKGTGVVKDAGTHVIEADTLRISPSAKDSVVQVEVMSPSSITVAARSGSADVRSAAGVLVASVRPGLALAFGAQAGAATAFDMTGVEEFKDGKYFLTDDTTHVTVQLEGPDLAKFVGKCVEVTGSIIPGATPPSPASQLIQVATIKATSCRIAGGAIPGGAGAGGAVATGLSMGARIAIIGGVAAAGTVAGLAAAGTFSSSSPSASTP